MKFTSDVRSLCSSAVVGVRSKATRRAKVLYKRPWLHNLTLFPIFESTLRTERVTLEDKCIWDPNYWLFSLLYKYTVYLYKPYNVGEKSVSVCPPFPLTSFFVSSIYIQPAIITSLFFMHLARSLVCLKCLLSARYVVQPPDYVYMLLRFLWYPIHCTLVHQSSLNWYSFLNI